MIFEFFKKAEPPKGMDLRFLFAGEYYHLSAKENEQGKCYDVSLTCRSARESFQRTLADECRLVNASLACGVGFKALIDGLGFSFKDRTIPVHSSTKVKTAGTIWDAAYQMLEDRYGATQLPMPPMRETRTGFLRVLDGGMA